MAKRSGREASAATPEDRKPQQPWILNSKPPKPIRRTSCCRGTDATTPVAAEVLGTAPEAAPGACCTGLALFSLWALLRRGQERRLAQHGRLACPGLEGLALLSSWGYLVADKRDQHKPPHTLAH